MEPHAPVVFSCLGDHARAAATDVLQARKLEKLSRKQHQFNGSN
jgi:hypothetical protein